jgi:hypothetical protein
MYQTNKGVQTLEVNEDGWCDLNDLDCFCAELFSTHKLGALSASQLERLAKKIYQLYSRDDLTVLQSVLSRKMLSFQRAVSERVSRVLNQSRQVAA